MDKKTVLIVDDTRMIRASVRYCLEKSGLAVEEAENGQLGLDKLKEMDQGDIRPALILSDINMPVMDGITFIKEVKKTKSRFIPILVLTTETSEDKKREGKQAGAAGWLIKPFQEDELIGVVRKFVPELNA
ncbi:MAG: response regulator [Myxococcota bacterium]|nr:response regulator [Myxococcota bacterium]